MPVIRVPAAHPHTAPLGPMFGNVTIEAIGVAEGGDASAKSPREATPS